MEVASIYRRRLWRRVIGILLPIVLRGSATGAAVSEALVAVDGTVAVVEP